MCERAVSTKGDFETGRHRSRAADVTVGNDESCAGWGQPALDMTRAAIEAYQRRGHR